MHGLDRGILNLSAIGVEQAAEVAQHPVGDRFGGTAESYRLFEELRHGPRCRKERGVIWRESEGTHEPVASSGGQLGKAAADLVDPLTTDVERWEVRLGKIPVVLGELLAALRDGVPAGIIPATRLLHQLAATREDLGLSFDLVADRAMDRAE